MTGEDPKRQPHDEDPVDESRAVRWLERAEPAIFVAIVVVIVLLWLLGRILGARWAGG